MQHNTRFEALCKAALEQVNEVTISEVHSLMQQGKLPLFIDVREDREWCADHLPLAIHMGRGVIERDIETFVPNTTTPIILYCGGGYRSVLVAESLQKMGYTHVASMAGGYRGWKEAQLPLVSD